MTEGKLKKFEDFFNLDSVHQKQIHINWVDAGKLQINMLWWDFPDAREGASQKIKLSHPNSLLSLQLFLKIFCEIYGAKYPSPKLRLLLVLQAKR